VSEVTRLVLLRQSVQADVDASEALLAWLTLERNKTPRWRLRIRCHLARRIDKWKLMAQVYEGVVRRIEQTRLDARAESETEEDSR